MSEPGDIADEARLAALASYGILDSEPEQGFDDLVELATQLCACPIALVSLVARDRQWFKARVNFPSPETNLGSSVCVHALVEPDLLVIPDLTADPRTAGNPLVTAEPHIRFYAGAPLRTGDGHALGSLCVIDRVTRADGLSPAQADALRALARQAVTLLELRKGIAAQRSARAEIHAREAHWRGLFERLSEGFVIGEVVRDATGRVVDWRYLEVNAAWGELVGIDPAAVIGRTLREAIPGVEDAWVTEVAEVVDTGLPSQFTRQVGSLRRWYEGRVFPFEGERFGVIFLEVTERVEAEGRRAALLAIGDRLRDLATVPEMTSTVAEIVGHLLGASRAGFGRVVGDVEVVEIEPDWTLPDVSSISGTHRFDDYGDIRAHLRQGETLVIDDVMTDPRTSADPSPMLALGIGALVNVPVRERGRTVAVFIVQDTRPRSWTGGELAFLRNVADRLEVGVARLRAEERQTLLNAELSHRLKNTLNMVLAIASQTLRGAEDQGAVAAFRQRVIALSTAHDVLLQQSWMAAPLAVVASRVLALHAEPSRFDLSGPEIELASRGVLTLSLLLHELATNAVKYGALSVEEGRVALAWSVDRSGEPVIVLVWSEVGGPPVVAPTRTGFGSRLIRAGLGGTGSPNLRYSSEGLRAEFRSPLGLVTEQ